SDDVFIGDYPELIKEISPPEVSARVFKNDPKFCPSPWMVVSYRRNRAQFGRGLRGGGGKRCSSEQQEQFRFRSFTVVLPHHVDARVTKRLSFDTYVMCDTGLLGTVYDVR
ncbi:hypothetical protein Tcan_00195, partial [Toxocara canis]